MIIIGFNKTIKNQLIQKQSLTFQKLCNPYLQLKNGNNNGIHHFLDLNRIKFRNKFINKLIKSNISREVIFRNFTGFSSEKQHNKIYEISKSSWEKKEQHSESFWYNHLKNRISPARKIDSIDTVCVAIGILCGFIIGVDFGYKCIVYKNPPRYPFSSIIDEKFVNCIGVGFMAVASASCCGLIGFFAGRFWLFCTVFSGTYYLVCKIV